MTPTWSKKKLYKTIGSIVPFFTSNMMLLKLMNIQVQKERYGHIKMAQKRRDKYLKHLNTKKEKNIEVEAKYICYLLTYA